MSLLVQVIVAFIIALQIFFFVKNVLRMQEYKQIFADESSWGIAHDSETKFVSGIYGNGNHVFESIKDSINKYLENNSGSVIDFSLLKDAVDRHCDSVENDINTLTPTPLYCGLAGTMAGVIVGLGSLITTGSITDLLSSGSGNFGSAANGVNDLLSGVAWAMLASIMGILLTTTASLLFKSYKLQGESGKNTFLAWLQARLLPELPSDTSDALNRLVKNLNKFNNTFAENTSSLRGALREVNESYRIQGDIIKAVHDMDVMKMAKANVRVLEELKECTDKLELFNEYLNDIHGYTDAIHKFTTQFEQESNRLHVLEEIQQYFSRHKAEIAKDAADSDVALREALRSLRESSESNATELNSIFVRQAENFKQIIKDEKESFENFNNDLKAQFSQQISQMPMLAEKLSEISEIPSKLNALLDSLSTSNSLLYKSFVMSMDRSVQQMANVVNESRKISQPQNSQLFPKWMNWLIIFLLSVISFACVTNTINNIWPQNNVSAKMSDEQIYESQTDSLITTYDEVQDTIGHINDNYNMGNNN